MQRDLYPDLLKCGYFTTFPCHKGNQILNHARRQFHLQCQFFMHIYFIGSNRHVTFTIGNISIRYDLLERALWYLNICLFATILLVNAKWSKMKNAYNYATKCSTSVK